MNDSTIRAIEHGVNKVLTKAGREQETADVSHDVIVFLLERGNKTTFDAEVGDYDSYAFGVAQQMAVNYLNTEATATDLPRWAGEWRSRQYRTEMRLAQELLREPTSAEVAEAMGESLAVYNQRMQGVYQHAEGLDVTDVDEDGEEVVLSELEMDGPTPLELLESEELRQQLWAAIYQLDELTRDIVCLMFGLNSRRAEYTVREVADLLHVPSSTVHYKMQTAMRHLRRELTNV